MFTRCSDHYKARTISLRATPTAPRARWRKKAATGRSGPTTRRAPPPNRRRFCWATATAPRCGCATWPRSSA